VVAEKAMTMMTTEPTMTPDELAQIAAPALVLVGDDDISTLAHTCSLYESLGAGQLAVVPGASHLVPHEKPALVNQIVAEFLASGGVIETLMPLRRT
jgi:pimeloyl-ACP methyl ester carboxylesterase